MRRRRVEPRRSVGELQRARRSVGFVRGRRAALLGAVAGAVLIAGCSGGGSGSGETVGSSPASAAASAVASVAVSTPTSPASVGSSTPLSTPSSVAITTTTVDPRAPVACSLLTVDEVSFVAGQGLTFADGVAEEAQETSYGAHTACTWTVKNDPGTTVRVSVWDDDSAFDDAKAQLGSTGDVAGVGDRAFSATLASIYAVRDGHTLFVQYADLDQDDAANLAISTTLAQLAVGRL
jgi:hypothetical protein